MRRLVSTVTLSLLCGLVAFLPPGTAQAASAWKERPATYGVHVDEDVPVTMSDGVVLRVNVYRPANADGTPVRRRLPGDPHPDAVQQVRAAARLPQRLPRLARLRAGRRRRARHRLVAGAPGTRSAAASRRTAPSWCGGRTRASRPWSNGKVGLWGVSYAAINQFFTAAQHPAGLKAMFPIVPAGDVYRDVVASGGQIDSGFIPFWLGLVTATGLVPPAYTATDPASGLGTLLQHASGAGAFQAPTVGSAVGGDDQAYDGPFYQLSSPLSVVDKVKVPTFVTGGEYDLFQRGEPMLYQRLRANGVPSRLLDRPLDPPPGVLRSRPARRRRALARRAARCAGSTATCAVRRTRRSTPT